MNDRKIEIKRNIIERFLMRIKEYFRENKKLVIYSFISIFIITALIISGVVYYKIKEKNEVKELESILDKYYSSNEENRGKNFQKAIDDLNTLISSSLWGYVDKNGYYIIAGLYLSVNNYDKGKEYLLKFIDKSSSSFFAPLALHRAGIACEKLNDINGALQIYQRLETEYGGCFITDKIYYDLGRINYIKGDLFKAREYYNKVISEYPASIFVLKAKKRLLLLGFDEKLTK